MTQVTAAEPGLRLDRGDHVCVFHRADERDELLLSFLSEGLAAGHKCLAVLDTSEPVTVTDALDGHAARDRPADQLTYEARVNQVLGSHPEAAISLCLYDVDRFDGELIVGVMRTHPKMVLSGTVVDNPFFIDPQAFLDQRRVPPG